MKNKITIKTTYIGNDQGHIKKGDPMHIICPKQELIAEHMEYNMPRLYNSIEPISLLSYVRLRIQKIREAGSVYY